MYFLDNTVTLTVGPNKTNLGHTSLYDPIISFSSQEMIERVLHHVTSTITGDISGRGLFRTAQQKYERWVFALNVISPHFPKVSTRIIGVNIIFSKEDVLRINPYNNDPLVVTVKHGN